MRLLRSLLPGIVVLAIALVASGVLEPTQLEGLTSTPVATLLLVPVLRLTMFVSGALALGGTALLLLGAGADVRRASTAGAVAFAISSAALEVVTLADVMAVQWWEALDPTMLRSFVTQIDEGRYLATQVVLGIIGAWVITRARQPLDTAFAAVALAIAVTLPGYTGHSAAAVTHWVASATMVAHLSAMSVWVGAVMLLAVDRDPDVLQRFGRVASGALGLLLVSGVASVLARTNDWAGFLGDPYAWMLGVKLALTGLLLVIAAASRRLVREARAEGRQSFPAAVLATLSIEVVTMGAVLAVAVVLARMPNP